MKKQHNKTRRSSNLLYLGVCMVGSLGCGYASSAPVLQPPVTSALNASTQLENQVRDAVAEAIAKFMHGKAKKFTASASGAYGWYKDSTSHTPVKGTSKAAFVAMAYQITPKISVALGGGKNTMSGKSHDSSLFNKMNDDILAAAAEYKVNAWLTLCAALSQTYGKFTSVAPAAVQASSTSKYVYTTPTLMARMVVPVYQKLVFVPEIGASRMYIHNRAYTDNASTLQPAQHKKLDQCFLDAKLGYTGFAMVTPFIQAGYSRVIKTSTSVKSRESTKLGGGVAIMGGLVSCEYTNQRVWGQFRDQQVKINVNVRF